MASILKLQQRALDNEKLTMLTCYDASFAGLLDKAGIDTILIGDSLGMVFQGQKTTLHVTLDDMIYHTRCVATKVQNAFVIVDMPFGTYQVSPQQAFENASKLMANGAHMVKIEGGQAMCSTVQFLVDRGIPVCGHIGLTPQAVHQLGGYRVQGRDEARANELINDAKLLEQAGASMIVLEMLPMQLAKTISETLVIPTIGIGSGKDCDGQVLVLYDMLGIYEKSPKFSKNFMTDSASIQEAVANYIKTVKDGTFPTEEHSFV